VCHLRICPAGIVVPASVLLANEGMVATAKAANLAVLMYGLENSDPGHVQRQALLGVQAVICDEVSWHTDPCKPMAGHVPT